MTDEERTAKLRAEFARHAAKVVALRARPKTRLPTGATPLRSSTGSRDTLCPRYSACLTVIERRRWPGFSCVQCKFYGCGADERNDWLDRLAAVNRCALGVG